MIDKNVVPTKILWVDLEMTGLDPQTDVILEIGCEITDFNFKTLATYEARFKQDREVVVKAFQKNVWYRDYPENMDQFLKGLDSAKDPKVIEQELTDLVSSHFGDEPAILAGNSIYNDRMFIKRWMPALDLKLHYRMLDVTAWKLVMQGKYGVSFEKQEVHRAFDDIQASIAELQYYLDYFKENHGSQDS